MPSPEPYTVPPQSQQRAKERSGGISEGDLRRRRRFRIHYRAERGCHVGCRWASFIDRCLHQVQRSMLLPGWKNACSLTSLIIVEDVGSLSLRFGETSRMSKLTRRMALIGLSTFVASPVGAQTSQTGKPKAESSEIATLEKSAVFEINPNSGSLKESIQKGQELIWHRKENPNDVRFKLTNISLALLRNESAGQLKMTFSCNISSLGRLEKFLSPSPRESDSVTARGNERMERASHGAEGLFRC